MNDDDSSPPSTTTIKKRDEEDEAVEEEEEEETTPSRGDEKNATLESESTNSAVGAATVETTSSSDLPPGLSANEMKMKVQFKSVGGAPILKKNKFQIKASETVAVVVTFLRKTLKLQDRDPLFVYVNSSFAPSLDQTIGTLHACFSVNDELVVHYALVKSYG